MTVRNLSARVVIVLGILAAGFPAAAQDEFKEIESRINEFTLANGWKFIVLFSLFGFLFLFFGVWFAKLMGGGNASN